MAYLYVGLLDKIVGVFSFTYGLLKSEIIEVFADNFQGSILLFYNKFYSFVLFVTGPILRETLVYC